jgi:lipopolysaccharide export system protein LptC
LTAVEFSDSGRHGFTTARFNDGGRRFRKAARHSRHVRMLRVGIPLIVVLGGFAAFVVMTWLDPLRALARLPVDIGGLVVSGTKITMQQPRLVGFTKDNRSYAVHARAAAQDVMNPDVLELQDITGTIEMQDHSVMQIVASAGLYESKADKLTLQQNILVTSASYEGRLTEAVIEIHKGNVVSDKPVELTMPQGTVSANRLRVVNSGEVIRFEGNVTMLLSLDSPTAKAGER